MVAASKISRRHEERVAREVGGRRQPGSGNRSGFEGDIRTERWLIEHKYTTTASFRVTPALLAKIEGEASLRYPPLQPAVIVAYVRRAAPIYPIARWWLCRACDVADPPSRVVEVIEGWVVTLSGLLELRRAGRMVVLPDQRWVAMPFEMTC